MSLGYRMATLAATILFLFVLWASHAGFGLATDAEAKARARSVRSGSLHARHYYGGGPGFGK